MSKFTAFVESLIDTYSTILFAKSKVTGLLILAATFTVPVIGFGGLLGVVAALLLSRTFFLDTWDNKSGLYGFNALLVSLGISYYFPLESYPFYFLLLIILLASLLSVLLFATLNHLAVTYLRIPSMSLSFSIVLMFFMLFWYAIGRGLVYLPHNPLIELSLPHLNSFWDAYFRSLGSIFFLPFLLTGMIIAVALLISSRISVLLSLLGFATIRLFYAGLIPTATIYYPGLNAILIAVTIGGIFIVPGKTAYLLAVIAVLIGGIILMALQFLLLPSGIPPFTLPYVITVFIVIYPLSLRLKNEKPYLIDFGTYHPEQNLIAFYNKSKRFYQTTAPQFYLPVLGEWKITQGNTGDETHKYQWAYAWDLEVYDRDDKPYKTPEEMIKNLKPEHYYAYGKPVLASADGYVAKVVDGIADNPIGQINTKENWGNVVTIHHHSGIYTLYGHLKNGSIKVKEGEYVKKGDRLGAVGNSGRSAVPHLHFNVQLGAEPGANTIKSFVANYKQKKAVDEPYHFHPYDIPVEGENISALVPSLNLLDLLHLKVRDSNRFKVKAGKEEFVENWEIKTNFYGQLHIVSDKGSCLEFSFYDGIYNLLCFTGSKKSALFAFAATVSRLPYQENVLLKWEDDPPLTVYTSSFWENMLLIAHSLYKFVTFTNKSTYSESKETIAVQTKSVVKVFGREKELYEGSVVFRKLNGIESILLNRRGMVYLTAEAVADNGNKQDNIYSKNSLRSKYE